MRTHVVRSGPLTVSLPTLLLAYTPTGCGHGGTRKSNTSRTMPSQYLSSDNSNDRAERGDWLRAPGHWYQVVADHSMAGGRQGSIADTCVEPIAMHSQLLGQAKHRPLLLKLCLGPELFREGDVAPRPANLTYQSRRNTFAPGRTEALHR